jgi:glycosyltransferase involved in cell wall biosynthesis
MNTIDLISICIPTYNQTIHLNKLLISIFEQKDVQFEVIITDDSTNNDVKILVDSFSNNGFKINYYKNTPSLGAPKNWNHGMNLAKGEFIKIMHHDQWFNDEYALKKLKDNIKTDKNSFVFSAATNIFQNKTFKFSVNTNELNTIINEPEQLILANKIGGPTAILFRKEAKIYFDEKIIWLVDVEFYMQLFHKKYNVKYINEQLYTSMTDFDSLTNNNLLDSEKQLIEYAYLYNKYVKKMSITNRVSYFFKIYNIIIIPLKPKYYFIQLLRLLKKIM